MGEAAGEHGSLMLPLVPWPLIPTPAPAQWGPWWGEGRETPPMGDPYPERPILQILACHDQGHSEQEAGASQG